MTVDIAQRVHAIAMCLGSGYSVTEPDHGHAEKRVLLHGPDSLTVIVRGPRAGQHEERNKLVFTIELDTQLAELARVQQLTARIGDAKSPVVAARDLERRLLVPRDELLIRVRDAERAGSGG
jgi:hypothetical protein